MNTKIRYLLLLFILFTITIYYLIRTTFIPPGQKVSPSLLPCWNKPDSNSSEKSPVIITMMLTVLT